MRMIFSLSLPHSHYASPFIRAKRASRQTPQTFSSRGRRYIFKPLYQKEVALSQIVWNVAGGPKGVVMWWFLLEILGRGSTVGAVAVATSCETRRA